MATRAGVKTTEFWLAFVVVIFACGAAALELYRGKLGLEAALLFVSAAVAQAGYALSRGRSKGHESGQDQDQQPKAKKPAGQVKSNPTADPTVFKDRADS